MISNPRTGLSVANRYATGQSGCFSETLLSPRARATFSKRRQAHAYRRDDLSHPSAPREEELFFWSMAVGDLKLPNTFSTRKGAAGSTSLRSTGRACPIDMKIFVQEKCREGQRSRHTQFMHFFLSLDVHSNSFLDLMLIQSVFFSCGNTVEHAVGTLSCVKVRGASTQQTQ